ncbi:MAG TPA: hypothetical protein PLU53_10750 [Bacteroidia bacterium]|nr:hypothetical protein [Bacteroidia bacterium]
MALLLSSLETTAEINYYGSDTIEFSGYTWVIKESFGKHTGPGNNFFSGSRENVWVDEDGKLHLKLRYKDDRWYCSEVRMLKSLGYGKYVFYIDRLPQPLDKDVVIGLFMYDHEDTSNFHKEIDIEFSKWGKEKELNTQYVIQPYEEKAFRFNSDLNRPTRHQFSVRKKHINFNSRYEHGINPDSISQEYKEWKYHPDQSYKTGNEKVSINLWLYKASEPSNLKELEIIISRFEFSPYKMERLLPALPTLRKSKKPDTK